MSPEALHTAVEALLTMLVAVIGWFLNRTISQVDGKLDGLTKADAERLAAIVKLQVQMDQVTSERLSDRHWREDITGFLQTQGFRKRDG